MDSDEISPSIVCARFLKEETKLKCGYYIITRVRGDERERESERERLQYELRGSHGTSTIIL